MAQIIIKARIEDKGHYKNVDFSNGCPNCGNAELTYAENVPTYWESNDRLVENGKLCFYRAKDDGETGTDKRIICNACSTAYYIENDAMIDFL